MPRSAAIISVIVLMIVWGSTFVVTKTTVHEIPPLVLAALRFAIAAVVLAPIVVARLDSLPQPPLGLLTMMGLTGVALFHVAFNSALTHGSASQAALIFALVPAVVAIAAVLYLHERLSRLRVIGIALSIVGVALVISSAQASGHSPRPFLGAAWMLVAVVVWAAYTVFAKRLADADQVVVVAYTTMIGLTMLIPLAIWELRHGAWPRPSLLGWLGCLYLGLVASALAFVVYGRALRVLDASLVGVFANLDPIVGVVMGVVFLDESLLPWQVAGAAVAIAGMWLASLQSAANRQGRECSLRQHLKQILIAARVRLFDDRPRDKSRPL